MSRIQKTLSKDYIKNKIKSLKQLISDAENKIENIRIRCTHPSSETIIKYGANTGNYDPTSDTYWIDAKCNICGKQWSADSSKDPQEYRRLSLLKYENK